MPKAHILVRVCAPGRTTCPVFLCVGGAVTVHLFPLNMCAPLQLVTDILTALKTLASTYGRPLKVCVLRQSLLYPVAMGHSLCILFPMCVVVCVCARSPDAAVLRDPHQCGCGIGRALEAVPGPTDPHLPASSCHCRGCTVCPGGGSSGPGSPSRSQPCGRSRSHCCCPVVHWGGLGGRSLSACEHLHIPVYILASLCVLVPVCICPSFVVFSTSLVTNGFFFVASLDWLIDCLLILCPILLL
jgi:hypothetical protein